jgi:hypothetical protein
MASAQSMLYIRPMSTDRPIKQDAREARRQRLADQLKRNLRRRKAQSRGRAGDGHGADAGPGGAGDERPPRPPED